jgi:hypothetical protein
MFDRICLVPEYARSCLRSDGSRLYIILFVIGAFSLGCLSFLTVVALPLSFTPPSPSDGVGWITVHGYSKQKEIFYYVAGILTCGCLPVLLLIAWIRTSSALASQCGEPVCRALRATSFALLAAPYVLYRVLSSWPPKHAGETLVRTLIEVALLWLVCAAVAVDRLTRELLIVSKQLLCHSAVLLAGAIFGWQFPYLLGDPNAAAAAKDWWLWPTAFWFIWILSTRILAGRTKRDITSISRETARMFLFSGILLFYSFALRHHTFQVTLLTISVAGAVLTAIYLFSGRGFDEQSSARLLYWWVGACVAILAGITQLAENPQLVPGVHVNALDGDHILAWFYNGLHGRVPFRDFYYPYGPLEYYYNLTFARVFGLDRYLTPIKVASAVITASILFWTAPLLYRTRLFLILAPVAMFAYSLNIRNALGFWAVLLTVSALENKRLAASVLAGVTIAIALLYSTEVGICAILAAQVAHLVYALKNGKEWLRTHLRSLMPVAAGFCAVFIPVFVIGTAVGALPGYVHSMRTVLASTVCCGTPFPDLLAERSPAPLGVIPNILKDSVFTSYYIAPAIYTFGVIYCGWLLLNRRKISLQDTATLVTLVFGGVLFRSALGRSDLGHVSFAGAPAIAVAGVLADRCILRLGFIGHNDGEDASDGGGKSAHWLEALLLFGFLGIVIALSGMYPTVPARISATVASLRNYFVFTRTDTSKQRDPNWVTVPGADGVRYEFPAGVAPMVKQVRDYLLSHLGPTDSLFSFPYESRYTFLTGRTTMGTFGPEIWSGASTPGGQAELVRQIETARPVYVVYDESEWPDGDGVAWMDRAHDVNRYIFDNYHIETKIGSTLLLRRGAPPSAPSWIQVNKPEASYYLRRGWYHLEPDGRWMSTHSEAVLTRQPNQKLFSLTASVHQRMDRRLTVRFNSEEVYRQRLDGLDGLQTFAFPIPGTLTSGAPLNVEIDVDQPIRAADARYLGLWVREFGFRSQDGQTSELQQPPVPMSARSSETQGAGGIFAISVSDPNGASDISRVQTIFNADLNGIGGCYIDYQSDGKLLNLAKDDGSWSKSTPAGASTIFENSHCALEVQKSTAEAADKTLVVRISVRFMRSFLGEKKVFVSAWDKEGHRANFVQLGSYISKPQ